MNKVEAPLILLVDDEQDLLAILELVVEQEGFRAKRAVNGAEALAWLHEGGAPSAIVLDLMMPELNGFQLLRFLKTHPQLSAIPVVVLSALTHPLDRFRAEDCGADAHIAKPFAVDDVLAVLKGLLAKGPGRDS
ncbi:MAG: response regulator [Cyanobacteria bacterium REEB65]|nr:response regulator [Cyanobacteria bacterium REEB65]